MPTLRDIRSEAGSRRRIRPIAARAKAWPHPVIADGRLYLRDLGVLWAYDLRAPKG